MVKKAEIAVVVPVYNVEGYIRQCLDSVVGQTMTEIEIIVVNDATPDTSAAIAREYAARDARIRVIDHAVNAGLSAARNTGMNAATAPLVMFVDSDDWVEPDYCRKLYEALTPGVDVAVCGIRFIYEADAHQAVSDERWAALPPSNPKWCNSVAWNKIYRMSIIREHGIEFPPGLRNEDEYFWNVYQPWCRAMAFVPEKLYNYRRREGGIMNMIFTQKEGVRPDLLHITALLGEYYEAHGLMLDDEWARHYWGTFDSLVRSSQTHRPEKFRKKKKFRKLRRLFKRKK